MSVLTTHRDYDAYTTTWAALRDAYAGSGVVKGAVDQRSASYVPSGVKMAGTRYLPRPAGMTLDTQYAMYRDRASWFGATEHIANGIPGAVMRKAPHREVPVALEPQLADITRTGMPLDTFAEQTLRETFLMGRHGVLVDFPKGTRDTDGTLLPPPPGSRPYWIAYQAEEIRNWRTVQQGGDTILSLVVLEECVDVPKGPWGTDDFFLIEPVTRYRVLRLNEAGWYEVSLWQDLSPSPPTAQRTLSLLDAWIPERFGQPLTFIPFVFVSPFSLEPQVQKSLLEALVEANFRCYRHSADYEHALFWLLPTPYICCDGLDPKTELTIGPSICLVIPQSNAKVGILATDPAGLPAHQIAIETDKKDMAMLGARLLEVAPTVQETARANENRLGGASSPVQSLISTVSQGLTQALQIHAWWAGMTENDTDPAIVFELNKDLVSARLDAQMLLALMQNLLNGTIAQETFYWNLQQGEIARPGIAFADEHALIEAQDEQRALAAPVPVVPTPPVPGPSRALPGQHGTTRSAA